MPEINLNKEVYFNFRKGIALLSIYSQSQTFLLYCYCLNAESFIVLTSWEGYTSHRSQNYASGDLREGQEGA